MKQLLQKKELHIFNIFDQTLAFDVNDMHLFEINPLAKAILEQAEGETPGRLVSALADRFPSEKVSPVVDQLMKIGLLGYQPPSHGESGNPPGNQAVPMKSVTLFVTQDCNLRCRYCHPMREGNIAKKNMSKEVALAAVDLLFKESGNTADLTISFYGGEPLLQFDLIKTIVRNSNRKAGELNKNITFSITTNGTLLTEEIINFLADNNIHVTLSIDGGPDTHDANRVFPGGTGSYAKLFDGYTRLKKRTGHIVSLAVVNNLQTSLEDIARSIQDIGIPVVAVAPAIRADGELDFGDSEVERYNRDFHDMVRYFLDNGLFLREMPPIDFSGVFKYLHKRSRNETSCNASYEKIAVDADGNILPCANFLGKSRFLMGNVLEGMDKSLQKTFKDLRVTNNQTCRSCWARYLCGGGCPYYSSNRYEDLEKPVETLCEINKNHFEVAMGVYSYLQKQKGMKTVRKNQENQYAN